MAIYLDPPLWPAHGTHFSHLVSDSSLAELHAFAAAAGIPERAFDGDHYDVPERRFEDLVAAGAIPVEARVLVRKLIASGLRVPAGASKYLRETGFEGTIITPFNGSAYLMWANYPAVRISMDSRYEAAYPEQVFRDFGSLYKGREGWEQTLDRYPADLLLVPVGGKLEENIASLPEWRPVYLDDGVHLYASPKGPGSDLPFTDRRNQPIDRTLPRQ